MGSALGPSGVENEVILIVLILVRYIIKDYFWEIILPWFLIEEKVLKVWKRSMCKVLNHNYYLCRPRCKMGTGNAEKVTDSLWRRCIEPAQQKAEWPIRVERKMGARTCIHRLKAYLTFFNPPNWCFFQYLSKYYDQLFYSDCLAPI